MHVNQSGHAMSSSSTLASSLGNPSSLHQVSRDSRHSRRKRPAPSTLQHLRNNTIRTAERQKMQCSPQKTRTSPLR